MSDKVKLPREVAAQLEAIRRERTDEEVLITLFNPNDWYSPGTLEINHFDRITLVRAILNGYEIEQTPEEKLREYYNEATGDHFSYNSGVKHGISVTLDFLGITIEGIND